MIRTYSNLCFALALNLSLLMKLFAVQDELIWGAVLSVILSALLTNVMRIRSIGIAGVGGLSLVYSLLDRSSVPGVVLTAMAGTLLVVAVLLAIGADLPTSSTNPQGGGK